MTGCYEWWHSDVFSTCCGTCAQSQPLQQRFRWWWTEAGIKLEGRGGIPPDLRSGTSCLRSTTSNNRSGTSQLRSGTFLLRSTTLHSLYLSILLYAWCFVKCSPSRSFYLLHMTMPGVDRCCKRQTLFKCRKSQTECLKCSKTPGRRSGTPPLLLALRARASALQASRL